MKLCSVLRTKRRTQILLMNLEANCVYMNGLVNFIHAFKFI